MITLINGLPQGPDGLIVPNGSVGFQLNVDATVIASPFGFISGIIEVVFQFDASGLIQPNNGAAAAQIYSNAELNPQNNIGLGTYYLVTFYDADNARINKNPMWWQFPEATGATVDISKVTPISTVGGNVIFYPTNFGGSGSVTSVAFVGDGTVLSATPSTPVTTSGNISATLLSQNANTFLAGPTSGPAADPTFRTITSADLPATLNVWSSLAAPIADLTLATTVFNTTFTSTEATDWEWSNLTAATSMLDQDSPALIVSGQAWISGANHVTTFQIQEHLGALYFTQTAGLAATFPYQFDSGLQIAGSGLNTPAVDVDFQTGGSGAVFVLTAAGNASVGLTTYVGTITAGAGPTLGMRTTIAGFSSGANNGSFIVHDSTLTTLTVYNGSGTAESHAGTATTDSPFYNSQGFGIELGNNASTFPIEGASYSAIASSQPFPYFPAVAISVKGNATDAAYLRIVVDGSTGNHGLEIGGIIDGTGSSPVTLSLGHYNGVSLALFNSAISAPTLFETTSHTPSSASDTGVTGQIAWDAGFIYICTATNTWKRVAITGGF